VAGAANAHVKRLTPRDAELARRLFATMAEVFGQGCESLSDDYVDRILAREDFWAIAACVDDLIVGGLTAHTLPMTSSSSSEIFIYDIAVRSDYQRQGVGRRLLTDLRTRAAARGISVVFVSADNADTDALDFYRALGGAASPVTFCTFASNEA
jgi:aminoglycoside 3-N-acetyltransferase I